MPPAQRNRFEMNASETLHVLLWKRESLQVQFATCAHGFGNSVVHLQR